MRRFGFLLGILSVFCCVFSSIAADTVVLWDFKKADVLKGRYPLTLRGKSVIKNDGLFVPAGAFNERAGAMTIKDNLAEFFEGNFSVSVKFSISSQEKPNSPNLVLLDNKYIFKSSKKGDDCGFMLFLKQGKNSNEYIPCAAFGYGNESVAVYGNSFKLSFNKTYTLKMVYDCRGKVQFFLDDVLCAGCKVPAKKIVKAKLPLHIGDRAGAAHWQLGGTIESVEIRKNAESSQVSTLPVGTVLGSWNFTDNTAFKGKYPLKLRGKAKLSAKGLTVVNSDIKQPAGAVLNGFFPELTPADAFELTAKIVLDKTFPRGKNRAMIFDAKYVAMPTAASQARYHKGFAFFLTPQGNNVYRLGGAFGFGESSAQASSAKVTLLPDTEYTLALQFSATGKVIFSVNNKTVGSANVPAGSLAPSEVNFTFGNRVGANYQALGGTIKSIEIRTAKFTPQDFSADISKRTVFERGEKDKKLWIDFINFSNQNLKDVTVNAVNANVNLPKIKIADAAGRTSIKLNFPVDTNLLPGKYILELTAHDANKKTIAKRSVEYVIVPAYRDFMPVMLWGNYEDIKSIREAGFTHQLVHLFPRQGNFDNETLKRWIPHLDENLKSGLYTFGTLHAHFRFIAAKRHLRTGKDGKVYPRANLEASHPAVQKEFCEAAYSTVKAVGTHPAFDGVLINSEVRDGALPSYGSGVEPAAFKKFAGFDIPSTISGKSPQPYIGNKTFPWDRVIEDNQKELVFLKWFWDVGDGWNPLQSMLSKTMHDAIPAERSSRFFTFYDPATRVPPMWGSGGNVDMISQWTYTYPDPIKIGQATDEVIAMGQGNPKQKIASMTQAIWYRSQTAPADVKVKNPPKWLEEEKNAMFVSVSPDSLREAFWSKISRRLDAIMYHGVGSLLAKTDHKLYRMTNYESRKVLSELCKNVVEPLGPVLKKVPERPAEVAILHSLAASFYAPKHFPMGWSKGWAADLHLALQWGHFQPAIIFDEHLLTDRGTEQLKVLFIPGLEVVTESVLKKLNQLRSKGVIIIGDEFTTPALMVDYRIQSISRNIKQPEFAKKELQKLGRDLSILLEKHCRKTHYASNQDLVVRSRGCDAADYVFIVNDKRTFGDYIGQWKLVQEKGLPNSGKIFVNHHAKAAYDLVEHKEINLNNRNNQSSFDVSLAPGDGKAILLLDRKIEKAVLSLPQTVKNKEKYSIECRITDKNSNPVKAYIPVELTLTASDGTVLPGSGFYAAKDGKLVVNEVMATNAPAGEVSVNARCLASGKTAKGKFTVEKQ